MFFERENGSVIEVNDNAFGFIYKCQLCPIGYGVNSANGQVEKTEVLKRSDIETEQYWERPTLPIDYNSRRKKGLTQPLFLLLESVAVD